MTVKGTYPKSQSGNYYIMDSIGVPHPYCIGAKLVAHAADHFNGMLGEPAIEDAERHGIYCEICKGKLKYKEHEQALLVSCPVTGITDFDKEEVTAWLKSIVDEATKNGYAGFSFMKRDKDA